MAMVMPQELSKKDLELISAFMRPGYEGNIPELTARGAAVLDVITGRPLPLRAVVVGRFVVHSRTNADGATTKTDEGIAARHSDALYNEDGRTGIWGVVVEDYEAPEDAFLIGVPL